MWPTQRVHPEMAVMRDVIPANVVLKVGLSETLGMNSPRTSASVLLFTEYLHELSCC